MRRHESDRTSKRQRSGRPSWDSASRKGRDSVLDRRPVVPEDRRATYVGASNSSHRSVRADAEAQPRPHKQNVISRLVNQWFDRVVGTIQNDGLSGLSSAEEQFASHKTMRDFVWNTIGSAAWAMVFPVVTMVSTQIVGVEQAGMISMAFVVGILLMFIGNFGVRTYQISDVKREHSFADYQINRWVTCLLMLLIGWSYCTIRGYSTEMFNISMAVIAYKFIDALADVYEGRLQQVDKLYLAGVSQTIRSVLALVVFIIVLLVTRSGVAACIGMAIAALATFLVITWPLALLETPKSRPFNFNSFVRLFKLSAPLFVAIFFFNLIENMPKFVMEGTLPYENQLYYNALYFPAQMILITAQLVYKPLLVRMAGVWQESNKRRKFNLILAAIIALIAAITIIYGLVMAWVGIPVLNFLYGVDFAQYKGLLYLMLVTGGITAAIDFLFQVITIMRRQKDVTVLFVMTFIFSIFIPWLLVSYAELEGAVLSYVIVEGILFVLLAWEYFRIRRDLHGKTLVDGKVVAVGAAHVNAEDSYYDAGHNAGSNANMLVRHGDQSANEGIGAEGYADERERTTFVPLMDIADPKIGDTIGEDEGFNDGFEEEPPRKLRPSEQRAIREHREEVMRRRTGKNK